MERARYEVRVSPTTIIHGIAGSPELPECSATSGRCWLCGAGVKRAMPVDKWLRDSFTDHHRARCPSSDLICEPCVWATAGRPPNTLRMYTHLVDDRGWRKLNKGDKAEMRQWLKEPKRGPWLAAIADSGQKHCVPYAPLNPAGSAGLVFFETGVVRLGSWGLVDDMATLLTAGATKSEIDSGDYSARAWQLCAESIQAFEQQHARLRGAAWFTLALWLAQRDEEAVQRRLAAEKEAKKNVRSNGKKAARRSDRGATASSKNRVPQDGHSQCAEALGHAADEDARGVSNLCEPGGVGDADREKTTGASDERRQLSMFDRLG